MCAAKRENREHNPVDLLLKERGQRAGGEEKRGPQWELVQPMLTQTGMTAAGSLGSQVTGLKTHYRIIFINSRFSLLKK